MIRFILQNLQFFLGAESCFVDTRQLVVIQLPVHKISELNNYLMRPNHNVGRGREQNKKKRPNMDNTRRSYSQSFTLLHIRIDIRQRQEWEREKWEKMNWSLVSHVCLSVCLSVCTDRFKLPTNPAAWIHFSLSTTTSITLREKKHCMIIIRIASSCVFHFLPSSSSHTIIQQLFQTPRCVQWYFYFVSTRVPGKMLCTHSDFFSPYPRL